MGSGKTTLGKGLARKLMFEFCDMDKLIEQKEGLEIADIFKEKGETYFRASERECLKSFSPLQNIIIATGGGAPCFYDNIDIMNIAGTTVYLKINSGILFSRLKSAKVQRPLIASKSDDELLEFIKNTLAEREVYYEQVKHVISGSNIKVNDIINVLKG